MFSLIKLICLKIVIISNEKWRFYTLQEQIMQAKFD
jgi:hypothetical protein